MDRTPPHFKKCVNCDWAGAPKFFRGDTCLECREVKRDKSYMVTDRDEYLADVKVGDKVNPKDPRSVVVRHEGKKITLKALRRKLALRAKKRREVRLEERNHPQQQS